MCEWPRSSRTRRWLVPQRLRPRERAFDSSRGGAPLEFQLGVGQVIRGWDEGILQMSVGERATLKCTSDVGYGARGAGGVIPPNADLNFDVELFGCK